MIRKEADAIAAAGLSEGKGEKKKGRQLTKSTIFDYSNVRRRKKKRGLKYVFFRPGTSTSLLPGKRKKRGRREIEIQISSLTAEERMKRGSFADARRKGGTNARALCGEEKEKEGGSQGCLANSAK